MDFTCEVNELLKSPDNIEIIRDQICGILALECANQFELATKANDPRKDDYNISVYLENTEPWAILSEDDKSTFPLVNVCLQDVTRDSGSDSSCRFGRRATFNIDVYNTGSFDGLLTDSKRQGRLAVIKCWKTARIIRNILEAANYTYLGLQGVVLNRQIESIATGMPNVADTSVNVCVCRIVLSVRFTEKSPQVSGPIIEPIDITITDDSGAVVVG